ncbi:MAG: extracellular solute-binding protein [Spirochaetales bacterium]|nr:extracellular solute-binding protein [Spirochaetales bacterium]
MKKAILLLIVLTVLFPLVANGGGDKAASAKEELSIIWWGSQNRHDRTIKAIELYMEKNPNVEVTYEFAGWTDYWTKTTTMAAGGMLPDVMQQDYARLAEWQEKNLLTALDPYIKDGTIDLSNVVDSAIAGGRINGELYGLNLGMNSECFVLDVDAFEKAGIPLPPQNWTWDQFESIARELHDKLGIYGMGDGMLGEQHWKTIYLSNGEYAYNDAGTDVGYTDESLFADYSEMIVNMQNDGVIPNRELELAKYGISIETKGMVSKESAMEYFWSNQLTALTSAAGEGRHFYMTHKPRLTADGPAANYLKPSMFFSISAQTENAAGAAKFINYFTNDLDVNKILAAERGVPISSAIRAGIKDLMGPAQIESFNYIDRVAQDNSPLPNPDPVGHSDIVNNVYNPMYLDPMCYGVITPQEAVHTLTVEAKKILAKNK